jgi:hypothetical protein
LGVGGWGLGFTGLGFRDWGLGFQVLVSDLRVYGLGFGGHRCGNGVTSHGTSSVGLGRLVLVWVV